MGRPAVQATCVGLVYIGGGTLLQSVRCMHKAAPESCIRVALTMNEPTFSILREGNFFVWTPR